MVQEASISEFEGSIDFLGRPSLSRASSMIEFYNTVQIPSSFYSPAPTNYSTDECMTPDHSLSEQDFETAYQQSQKPISRRKKNFVQLENGNVYVRQKLDRFGPTSAFLGHDFMEYSSTRSVVETPPTPESSTEGYAPTPSETTAHLISNQKPFIVADSSPLVHSKNEVSELDSKSDSKSKRKRKAQNVSKGEKPKIPKLDKPLSELTKDLVNLPIRDMERWVHRSVEERRKEVEKRDGHVARPMNSFMLYRSAFAERTKQWCLQNNHQVVSSVSGASWPLEPAWIREKYNELARIERINHQAAHPGYKFSPSKNQPPAIRRRKTSLDGGDEIEVGPSDTEEMQVIETQPVPRLCTKKRQRPKLSDSKKHAPLPDRIPTPPNSLTFSLQEQNIGINIDARLQTGAQKSSYAAVNPGRPAPTSMTTNEATGTYYQTIVRPTTSASARSSMIEDVTIRKTTVPAASSLSFLPGEAEEKPTLEEYIPYQRQPQNRLSQEQLIEPKQEQIAATAEQNFWVYSHEATPEADFEQYRILLEHQAQNVAVQQAYMLARGDLAAPYSFVSPGLVYTNTSRGVDFSNRDMTGVNYSDVGPMWHGIDENGGAIHGDLNPNLHYEEWLAE
ncbi:hypothetical protein TWF694_007955 [Orbilia ellipsospora]|uniref:HMG box domain-containing protein n=1 Tax=Orbilia ellipsospora TaxID=2528407 RepID=A0AAV9XJB4_9PEZI